MKHTLLVVSLIACLLLPFQGVFSGISSIQQQLKQQAKEKFFQTYDMDQFAQHLTTYRKKHGPRKVQHAYTRLLTAHDHATPFSKHRLSAIIGLMEQQYNLKQPAPTVTTIKTKSLASSIPVSSLSSTPVSTPPTTSKTYQTVPTKTVEETVEKIEEPLSADEERIVTPTSQQSGNDQIYQLNNGTINISTLQSTRLGRVNTLRTHRGLGSISFHPALHRTAGQRSVTMRNKGVADHKRTSGSSYYNYGELVDRFEDRGVVFANRSRATFTENVGYGRFVCTQGDCTDVAIESMRGVFEYFISEEGQAYDAHRRTIIHPRFEIIGIGIAIDEVQGRLYTTQHYGTAVE